MNTKTLQIKTWHSPEKSPTLGPARNITVFNQAEGYFIHVANYSTMKEEHPDLETSLIEIKMRNGHTWKGSINDLEAIFATCSNAVTYLLQSGGHEIDLVAELQNILNNYR